MYSSIHIHFGCRWKWVVSFKHRPFFSHRKRRRGCFFLEYKPEWAQEQCWALWRREISLVPIGNRTTVSRSPILQEGYSEFLVQYTPFPFKLMWPSRDDWAWLSRVQRDIVFRSVLRCSNCAIISISFLSYTDRRQLFGWKTVGQIIGDFF